MIGTDGTTEITSDEDVIDSREVIARIAHLESLIGDENWLDDDERAELAALRAFAEQSSGAADWEYGEQFIRDSYFVDYAQELAEDLGAIDGDAEWPMRHIDWEAAADELQTDYTSVEFDGVTYWARF